MVLAPTSTITLSTACSHVTSAWVPTMLVDPAHATRTPRAGTAVHVTAGFGFAGGAVAGAFGCAAAPPQLASNARIKACRSDRATRRLPEDCCSSGLLAAP